MIAVIFEVFPAEGQKDRYLNHAAKMREHLDKIDGFVSVERFESLTTPGKLLSLSIWRDEDALAEWRKLSVHRTAQGLGRSTYFAGYRLRVASVIRDYGMEERAEAPLDSRDALGG